MVNQSYYPAPAFVSVDSDEARNPQRFIHVTVIANVMLNWHDSWGLKMV